MTVEIEATREVAASPREVLEFVLDLERYREADTKIGRIRDAVHLDEHGTGRAAYWGRLPGTPPAPDVNLVHLDRWRSLSFTGAPRQPARLLLDFEGRFRCEPTSDGCRVTHGYSISFRRPLRWIYEPLLRARLPHELDDELARMQAILGRAA